MKIWEFAEPKVRAAPHDFQIGKQVVENVEKMLQVNEEYKTDEALTIKTNVLSEGKRACTYFLETKNFL